MGEASKLTIRRNFPRPPRSDLEAFEKALTGWVADAQGRRGALPHTIKPITGHARFVGTALTVQTRPVDNLAPYAALRFAKPSDVLVIAAAGDDSCAVAGDVLLGMARNTGIVAAVTDGLVRDVAGIEDVGIPVFARGLTPNSPFKDGPGSVGLPVAIGGVAINAGDIVVGDRDGVVVVPQDNIRSVIAALDGVSVKEAAMEKLVEEGATHPAWLDEILESGAVDYLD